MFIGHFAPALVAATSPRAPGLGTLFVAAQLVDWGFFTLAMVGVEKMRIEPGATAMVPFDLYQMPYTHSLIGAAGWALAFGLVIMVYRRNAVGGMLAGLVVLSHWVLDWLTHRPDLTLTGSGEAYGLGLWNYPAIAIPLEIGIVLAAFLFYLRRTRGPVGQPVVLLTVMLAMQAVNWFGPEPEQASVFLYVQALIAFAVITALAVWVGENRYYSKRRGLAAGGL